MKELNTNSEEISNQGLKIKRIIKVWSNEEDALLAKYHTEFNGNWQLISPQMKGRNVS
jgi:hypothetical protein